LYQFRKHILVTIHVVSIHQQILGSSNIKDFGVDVLLSFPFLRDALIHDLGFKYSKHLILLKVPKTGFSINIIVIKDGFDHIRILIHVHQANDVIMTLSLHFFTSIFGEIGIRFDIINKFEN